MSGQWYTHIETSQLICSANQLTGFYMSVTLTWYGLIISLSNKNITKVSNKKTFKTYLIGSKLTIKLKIVLVTLLLTLEKFLFFAYILKTLSNSSACTTMISSRKYSFFISITFFTSRSTRYFTLIKWLCKALNKWIVPARPTPHIAITTRFVELKRKKN